MPKVIVHLKENFLKNAKKIIEEKGYDSLSRKELAKESQVAVGTIYNYFPDKNSLLASIVFEDWSSLENSLLAKIESLSSFEEGVLLFCDSFGSFSSSHQELFSHFTNTGTKTYYDSYQSFVEKAGTLLEALCHRFNKGSENTDYKLAASLFSYAIHYPSTDQKKLLEAITSLLD